MQNIKTLINRKKLLEMIRFRHEQFITWSSEGIFHAVSR